MLSIVYITMNRASELERSIKSCERCVSIEHEYVIVDNGSTDDTEAVISKLSHDGYPILYEKQSYNLGVAGGRNRGFKLAKGDICYFIDDDAIVDDDGLILDKAYSYISTHDDLYAMSTNCYDTAKETFVVGGFPKNGDSAAACYVKGYTGFSHFIAKSRYHKEYLYPDNLIYGSEEAYFALTAFNSNKRIWYYKEMLVKHIPSKNTRNSRYWQRKNAYINTYVIKRYFYPKTVLCISTMFFILRAIKNEKGKFWNVKEYIKEANLRYKKEYTDKMTLSTFAKLIKTYGMMSTL